MNTSLPVSEFINWVENTATKRNLGVSPAVATAALRTVFAAAEPHMSLDTPADEFIRYIGEHPLTLRTAKGVISGATARGYFGKARKSYASFARYATKRSDGTPVSVRATMIPPAAAAPRSSRGGAKSKRGAAAAPKSRRTIPPKSRKGADTGPFGKLDASAFFDVAKGLQTLGKAIQRSLRA